jgi:hypothetical protein
LKLAKAVFTIVSQATSNAAGEYCAVAFYPVLFYQDLQL